MLFERKEIELLEGTIPKYERVKPGLISILKAHSETNLTNFLAYLFKGEDYPQLQEIFLQSFIDCINLDPHDDNFLHEMLDEGFDKIRVYPEYLTKSGKIDILIVKESSRQYERAAIIIENKLYHEFNNDLDDYFYSVCENMNVLPRNIAVVALTLKPLNHAFPNYMKSGKVLHLKLKKAIEDELGKNESIKNDRSANLLINEYLIHIEDLHLESTVYSNIKCYEFYSNNRITINSIVKKAEGMSFENFDLQNPVDKKILFELKKNIEDLVELKKNISTYASEAFNHYLTLTERKVQGPDYFRGRGLAFDAIRYKLDFQNTFNNDSQILLEVWLDGKFLADHNINIKDISFQSILNSNEIKIPDLTNLVWFKIHTDTFEIDDEILNKILREKIEHQWGKLESKLSESIATSLIFKFNNIVLIFFDNLKGFNHKIIDNGNVFQFAYSTTEAFFQYSVKYSPPDLIEIILYVENTFWEDVEIKFLPQKGFTKFTQAQSYQIPELNDEQLGGNNRNYDALLKKSYRIKSLDEVEALFENEKPVWTEVEKSLVQIIESSIS